MSFESTDQPVEGFEPPVAGPAGGHRAATPAPPPPPVARQLVRDPYTRLGGVASGLSHHYGIDVSLIRLAFVLFTITSGFGLLVYILAWLIIPRAKYWPPVASPPRVRSLSTRELGFGLLVLGALVGLFLGGGTFSQVIVPVVLVVGGIWLLLQSEAGAPAPSVPSPPTRPVDPVQPADPVRPVDPVLPAAGTIPAGTPVERRPRRWRAVVIGLVITLVVLPMLAIVAAISFLVFSDFDIDGGFVAEYRPETISDLPRSIDHGQGEITVDLTQLDPGQLDGDGVPLDINLDLGEIRVIVPADLDVDVEAEADLGQVNVFDNTNDGVNPRLTLSADDADLQLNIAVGLGEVTVTRGQGGN